MPAGSKAARAEAAIRASVKETHGSFSKKRVDQMVYGRLNNMGLMHGSKTTAAGRKTARTTLSR